MGEKVWSERVVQTPKAQPMKMRRRAMDGVVLLTPLPSPSSQPAKDVTLFLSLSLSNPNNPLLRINLSNYCPYASGQNLVVLLICGRTIPKQQAIGQGPFAYGQNLPQQQAIGQFSQRTPLLPLPKVRYSNDKKQKKQLVAGNDWESHGLGGIELCINWEKCDSHNDSIIELTTPFSSFYP